MKADIEDKGFMERMKELLGMEPEEVEKLLDTIDADSLLDLTDAVSENDKEAAEKILSTDEEINSLFTTKQEKRKKHPVKPPHDHQFMYGDDVAIIVNKDNKKEFVSATIYKPDAPGNTVGVKIEGKPKMVDKNKIYTLEENVMGMIGIPNLQRMQQLAGIGISPSEPETGVATEVVPPAQEEPHFVPPIENTDCPVEKIMAALDIVADVLPNIRLADLKVIRQKFSDLQAKMNESMTGMGRPKKKI
jgi:hypothetical protein